MAGGGKYTYGNLNSIDDGGDYFTSSYAITVNPEAFIYNFNSTLGPNFYDTALLLMNGVYTVTVNGVVGSAVDTDKGRGIEIDSALGVSKLTIGDSGDVFGIDCGVCLFQPTTVSNAGTIESTNDALYAAGIGTWTITNTIDGLIQGQDGYGIWVDAPGIHTIINAGGISTGPGGFAIYATLNGMEKLTNSVTGDIGDVFLGDNIDTFINAGTVDDVDLGTGNDIFTNSGTVFGDVLMGSGADSLTNSRDIYGYVDMGSENDVLINSGEVSGYVDMGSGNDVLTNSGEIDGQLLLGSGDNTFTNSGTVDGAISSGDGNDILKNSGKIFGSVSLGIGNDAFTNTGSVPSISMGDGNDTLTNTGPVTSILMGDGNDTLTNTGPVTSISMGDGNDTLTNTGRVTSISMGNGDDVFNGGSAHDLVTDEFGSDTYKLLAGDDTYVAIGNGSWSGIDNVDGGTGLDTYLANNATSDLNINLDLVAHFDPIFNQTNAAKTATDFGVQVGTDLLLNFENVYTGSGDDSVFGSVSDNILSAGDGDDNLFGLAGRDVIYGGHGIDDIFGGAGRDTLIGGNYAGENDGQVDTFHYTALADSTVGKSGRDLIANFEDGIDKIDLSVINQLPGMDLFFIGTNVAFGQSVPGDIRALTTGSGWLIQIDAGVDGKPDMAIEVQDPTHSINWGANDFILV